MQNHKFFTTLIWLRIEDKRDGFRKTRGVRGKKNDNEDDGLNEKREEGNVHRFL